MKTFFLKRFLWFDRTKTEEQVNTMFYSSVNTMNSMKNDIKINNPISFIWFKNKGLVNDGNHRLSHAIKNGINDIPAIITIKGSLKGDLKKLYDNGTFK